MDYVFTTCWVLLHFRSDYSNFSTDIRCKSRPGHASFPWRRQMNETVFVCADRNFINHYFRHEGNLPAIDDGYL